MNKLWTFKKRIDKPIYLYYTLIKKREREINKMTIKEFYELAKKNGAENLEMSSYEWIIVLNLLPMMIKLFSGLKVLIKNKITKK